MGGSPFSHWFGPRLSKTYAEAPGNVLLTARATGLPQDSVANPTQIVAIDKELLTERIAKLSRSTLASILSGIDIILGR